MGIRGRVRKLAMAAAVPGMVMGAFAAVGAAPAMASTASHHAPSSGYETFHGYGSGELDGHFGLVPLYANGEINDHGFIDLLGPNSSDLIHLSHGDLGVHYTGHGHEHLYKASCTLVLSANLDYTITGGTREYTGAHGFGHSHVELTAVTDRNNHGQCVTNRILPWSVRAYFDASGPLGFSKVTA